MQTEGVMNFFWPEMGSTVSIVALVLALAIFIFGAFSGARANKLRVFFAVFLSTGIGWFAMPLAIKAAKTMHIADTQSGGMILITIMMLFVSAIATSIYEIITVTLPDVGMGPKK